MAKIVNSIATVSEIAHTKLASQVRHELRAVDEARPDSLFQCPLLWAAAIELHPLKTQYITDCEKNAQYV